MLRSGRLISAADYRRTYSDGTRASARSVVAHVLATDERGPPRIGVTAARGLGGAVKRNRAKRRLREVVRALAMELRPGADVVLVATPATLEESFQNLVDNARSALARAGGCR